MPLASGSKTSPPLRISQHKTSDDQTIRMVDLKQFDAAAKAIQMLSTKSSPFWI